jgi:hypothetical protein
MKFVILILAAFLVGCDMQPRPNSGAKSEELAAIDQRMTALEGHISVLEQTIQKQQQAVGNWTLWQVSEALNSGYPQALSAYFSKTECLTAAGSWAFPGGKVVAQDPTIFQLKGYRIRLECLPVGTTPYAH